MPADPIGEDNPIEAILLTAFPNPERVGCPSADVIKAMANQQIGHDDPTWKHIWNCSPCFRDFKVQRDERVARVEREFERKRIRRNLIRGAAAVLISSGLAYYAAIELRPKSRHSVDVVPLDLSKAGATRGEATPIGRLPRQLDEIWLTLPPGSPEGRYVVAVLESRSENTAVALGSAIASKQDGQIRVVVTLDLSSATPGEYYLGTRIEVVDHQGTPNYYPILISD